MGEPSAGGNAPAQSLPEMIRVTKPAGILCFSYGQHWFENDKSGWQKVHEEMLETGLMKELFCEIDTYIPSQNISGLYFVCQKF